ncbi:MAG: hypothetical protein ACRECF_07360 [Methyloceanibacter sp.]
MRTLSERVSGLFTTPEERALANANELSRHVSELHEEIGRLRLQVDKLQTQTAGQKDIIDHQAQQIRTKDDRIEQLLQAQAAAEVHLQGFMAFSEGARERMMRGRAIAEQTDDERKTARHMARRFAPQPEPAQITQHQPQPAPVVGRVA